TTAPLHSFPTRRSSDLPPSYKMPAGSVNLAQVGFSNRMHQLDFARPGGNNLPAPEIRLEPGFIDPVTGQLALNVIDTSVGTWNRSEEHTSELQSRGHLV